MTLNAEIKETAKADAENSIGNVSEISFQNCNSIDSGGVQLHHGKLNIKYGPNGTGKSTIARALQLNAKGGDALHQLTPFKFRGDKNAPTPTVSGAEGIQSVLVFDEGYVSQFTFQSDEVLKDSFEIFINTPEYRQGLLEIEALFKELTETFAQQSELEAAIDSFTQLKDAFGVTKAGSLSQASKGFKALNMVSKLRSIPKQLSGFRGFLASDNPAGWITWQAKGKEFLDHSDNCPFCSTDQIDKGVASLVSEEYNSAEIKNLSAIRSAITQLGDFIEPEHLIKLQAITSEIDELSPEQKDFLTRIRMQIQTLLDKLIAVRAVTFYAFKDEANIKDKLSKLKVELSFLDALDSTTTRAVAETINSKLDEVADRIAEVGAKIGRQKSRVQQLISQNQKSINDFLRSAGYKYSVRIIPGDSSYRMILEHADAEGHLGEAAQHLSYGEKNAFALILFMHHVRQAEPDLIVLDDPVSSFDKTKKFAILHELFNDNHGIRNFTTLFLTHDIEPVIDVLVSGPLKRGLQGRAVAHFLRTSSGVLQERSIERGHVSTFTNVCDTNVAASTDVAVKCIYLRRRLEVSGDYGPAYQLLSSAVHLRIRPTKTNDDGEQVEMLEDEIHAGLADVRQYLHDFDYEAVVEELRAPLSLIERFDAASAGYEKVQLFRMFSELPSVKLKVSTPFQKFVNESFHIENEYVMQLNPREFDSVPEFIVDECAQLINDYRENHAAE